MFKEIVSQLEKAGSLHDLIDAIVVSRLRETHDLYLEEWDRLIGSGDLTDAQQQDLAELTEDLKALKHVIGFYEAVH